MYTLHLLTAKGNVASYDYATYEAAVGRYYAWKARRNTPAWITNGDVIVAV